METSKLSQKLTDPVFVLLLIIITTACSKDDEIKPSNGNDEILASQTIGSSGGVIEIDSLSITIPPGTFSGESNIKLSISNDPHPFKKQLITNFYQVNGIPYNYKEPIWIAIKYNDKLEDDSFIALGFRLNQEGKDTAVIFYDLLLECKDSSGYLTGKLMPFFPS